MRLLLSAVNTKFLIHFFKSTWERHSAHCLLTAPPPEHVGCSGRISHLPPTSPRREKEMLHSLWTRLFTNVLLFCFCCCWVFSCLLLFCFGCLFWLFVFVVCFCVFFWGGGWVLYVRLQSGLLVRTDDLLTRGLSTLRADSLSPFAVMLFYKWMQHVITANTHVRGWSSEDLHLQLISWYKYPLSFNEPQYFFLTRVMNARATSSHVKRWRGEWIALLISSLTQKWRTRQWRQFSGITICGPPLTDHASRNHWPG